MVALEHAAYRRDLGPPAYLGGPFADRLGGLFTFDDDSLEVAESVIGSDPFVREGLLESSVVKQWVPEWAREDLPRDAPRTPRKPLPTAKTVSARSA